MKEAYYNFHDQIKIKFITDKPEFFEFVDKNLSFFRSEKQERADLETKVYFFQASDFCPEKRVASDLFVGENKVLFLSRLGFKVLAEEKQPFSVNVYVWSQLLRDAYNAFFAGSFKTAREEKYLTLMRHSLYLPLFYLLEKKEYFFLHGSAVAKDKKAYLFIGANKVGKTTTALNLVYRYGFKFLSDDFLAIKDNQLYAFPDRIRVTSFTLDSLPIKTEKSLLYSKFHFDLPLEKIETLARPSKIFLTMTGKETKIEKKNLQEGLKFISSFHNYIREFPEHSFLTFLPKSPSLTEIQKRVKSFLEDKEIFLFCQDEDIDKNIELLNAYL